MATIDKYNTLPEQVLINMDKISDLETETKTLDTGLTDLGETINKNYDSLNERITENTNNINTNYKSLDTRVKGNSTNINENVTRIETLEQQVNEIYYQLYEINENENEIVIQSLVPNYNGFIQNILNIGLGSYETLDYSNLALLYKHMPLSNILLYIHNDYGEYIKCYCNFGTIKTNTDNDKPIYIYSGTLVNSANDYSEVKITIIYQYEKPLFKIILKG